MTPFKQPSSWKNSATTEPSKGTIPFWATKSIMYILPTKFSRPNTLALRMLNSKIFDGISHADLHAATTLTKRNDVLRNRYYLALLEKNRAVFKTLLLYIHSTF